MAGTSRKTSQWIGQIIRSVTVVLIAGVCRWRSATEIKAEFKSRPIQQQAFVSAAVLSALFALSVLAASFGWVGLLVFWLIVIAVVN